MTRCAGWIVLLAACLPFAHVRLYPHVHDDHDFRGPGSLVADARAGADLLWRADVFGTVDQPHGHSGFWRPLLLLSFRGEHWLTGGRAVPFAWLGHVLTLLAHALASWALWRFVLRLGLSPPAALATALLFAVHPVHAEPVAWLSGRTDIVPAGLVWLGCVLLLRPERGTACTLTALGTFVAALLFKETAVLLIALAVPLLRLSGRSWRAAAGVPVLATGLVLVLRAALFSGGLAEDAYVGPPDGATRWFTWLSILPDLIRLALWPGAPTPIHPVTAATHAAAPGVVAGLMTLALLAAITFTGWRSKRIALFYGAGLLLGTLLVLAPWVRFPLGYPEVAAPLYERHLYAAAMGPALLLGAAWGALLQRVGERSVRGRLLVVALGLGAVWLGRQAHQRTTVWASDEAFARAALRQAPRSAHFWNHLGLSLSLYTADPASRREEALTAFDHALSFDPQHLQAGVNRFLHLLGAERHAEATQTAEVLVALHPDEPLVLYNVGLWHLSANRVQEAGSLLERALASGRPVPAGTREAWELCVRLAAEEVLGAPQIESPETAPGKAGG